MSQMPTGTGKTITLLSLITSYQLAHPEVGNKASCAPAPAANHAPRCCAGGQLPDYDRAQALSPT